MNSESKWPAIRVRLLRTLDRLWIAGAIVVAGIVLGFWAITQQVEYLTFGVFVQFLVLLGWIATRVRFLRKSSSPTDFAIWAQGEFEQTQRRSDAVSRTNGALLLVSGLAGLVVAALSIPPWSMAHIAWLAVLLGWAWVGSWLILAGHRR